MDMQSSLAADIAYGTPANDGLRLPLALSLFVDRPHLRAQIRDDAEAAGFRVAGEGGIASLLEGEARVLGEVVLVDCPEATGMALAALSRLDVRAAQSGARLIVTTTVDALDDVFACLDRSGAQILVDPGRAEWVIALGRVLAAFSSAGLRELSEADRLTLLRLSEQVDRIAERLERLSQPLDSRRDAESDYRFESPRSGFAGGDDDEGARLSRPAKPPMPDPRLVRRIIRQRQLRARFFNGDLFADPAWDILLDLTAARAEHQRVSVTSLCIASGVPPTTALRWIGQMTESGLLERVEDEVDRRRAFIALTDRAADAMARFFAELGGQGSRMV